jgi:pimeloyl-ACP methyl ester carboxylesterase
VRRIPVLLCLLALTLTACDAIDAWLEEDELAIDEERLDDDTRLDDAPTPRRALPTGGELVEVACPFELETSLEVDCAELTVPESRTGLSDATITLPVAVLRSPAEDVEPDPVVFLQGGPGGVSLAEHWSWLSEVDDWEEHPILARRDLVLFDQRGTGYAEPSLNCDEDEEPGDCHDRLVEEGVTLAAYSTPENAADVADLRDALGYEEWNLFGSSYGTRLGLVVLRDHPTGVRSLVLDGVYPPETTPAYERFVPVVLEAIDAVAEACLAQTGCADAYGDVRDLLADAADAIEEEPTEGIDGWDLVDLVVEALYDLDRVVDIPLAVSLAEAGEVAETIDLLEGEGDTLPFRPARQIGDPAADSAGFFHVVECREEHAFTDVAAVEAELDPLVDRYGLTVIESLYANVWQGPEQVCPDWDVGVAADDELAPATGATPVLLLAGGFDPVTPASYAEVAAASLDRATVVVSPGLSHQSVLADPCIDGLVGRFLDDPSAPVDAACAADIAPPTFTLPG